MIAFGKTWDVASRDDGQIQISVKGNAVCLSIEEAHELAIALDKVIEHVEVQQ